MKLEREILFPTLPKERAVIDLVDPPAHAPARVELEELYCVREGCECEKVTLRCRDEHWVLLGDLLLGVADLTFHFSPAPGCLVDRSGAPFEAAVERALVQDGLLEPIRRRVFFVEEAMRRAPSFVRSAPAALPVARTQPCPCGSRRKYKNCCFAKDREEQAEGVAQRLVEEKVEWAKAALWALERELGSWEVAACNSVPALASRTAWAQNEPVPAQPWEVCAFCGRAGHSHGEPSHGDPVDFEDAHLASLEMETDDHGEPVITEPLTADHKGVPYPGLQALDRTPTETLLRILQGFGIQLDEGVIVAEIEAEAAAGRYSAWKLGLRWAAAVEAAPEGFVASCAYALWRRLAPATPCVEVVEGFLESAWLAQEDYYEDDVAEPGREAHTQLLAAFRALPPRSPTRPIRGEEDPISDTRLAGFADDWMTVLEDPRVNVPIDEVMEAVALVARHIPKARLECRARGALAVVAALDRAGRGEEAIAVLEEGVAAGLADEGVGIALAQRLLALDPPQVERAKEAMTHVRRPSSQAGGRELVRRLKASTKRR